MNAPTFDHPLPQECEVYAAWLKLEIERLSARAPAESRYALTPRGTAHVVYANGYLKKEGAEMAPSAAPAILAQQSLESIREYAESVAPSDEERVLYWRAEPKYSWYEKGLMLRLRLAFERL